MKVDQVSSICDMFGDTEMPQSVQSSAVVVTRLQWFHLQDKLILQPKGPNGMWGLLTFHCMFWGASRPEQTHLVFSHLPIHAWFRLPAHQVLENGKQKVTYFEGLFTPAIELNFPPQLLPPLAAGAVHSVLPPLLCKHSANAGLKEFKHMQHLLTASLKNPNEYCSSETKASVNKPIGLPVIPVPGQCYPVSRTRIWNCTPLSLRYHML